MKNTRRAQRKFRKARARARDIRRAANIGRNNRARPWFPMAWQRAGRSAKSGRNAWEAVGLMAGNLLGRPAGRFGALTGLLALANGCTPY